MGRYRKDLEELVYEQQVRESRLDEYALRARNHEPLFDSSCNSEVPEDK
jgi:hypothetical protein